MTEWRGTYEDPETGEPRTLVSPRPLRNDEVVAVSRGRWGKDAKILKKDPYPGTPAAIREAIAAKPMGGVVEQPSIAEQRGETPVDWEKKALPEIAGFGASMAVGGGLPGVLGKMATPLVTRGVLPNLPRLGRFLGLTGSGTAAGVTQPLVAGRPEDVGTGAYWGTALAGLPAGVAAHAKGALSRSLPGHMGRAGEAMAKEVGEVAATQVPAMQGLETSGQLLDWGRRGMGKRAMSQMFGVGVAPLKAALPPEMTRAGFAPAMQQWQAYQTQANRLSQQGATPQMISQLLGPPPPRPGLNIPAISKDPLPLEEAMEILSTKGTSFIREANARGVQVTRRSWMEGWDQLYNEARSLGVPQDVLDALTAVRGQYAMGKGYQSLLGEGKGKGAVPTTEGTLDPQKLQEKAGVQIGRLEKRFGEAQDPTELNKLLDVLFRGYKDPKTGQFPVGSVTKTDLPGGGLLAPFRYYLTSTQGGGLTGRAGMVPPNVWPWPKYRSAPGRLPLEIKPENVNLLNMLMQLGRAGVQAWPASEP